MVNSYDIAILSEKVARLEALLAGGGVALPEVTSEDNGATLQVVEGAWAKGDEIPGVINALDSTSTTDALSAAQGKALNDKFSVKTATITNLVTNAYGNIDLGLIAGQAIILAVDTDSNTPYTIFKSTGTSHWFAHFSEFSDGSAKTDLTVSGTVYYIEL